MKYYIGSLLSYRKKSYVNFKKSMFIFVKRALNLNTFYRDLYGEVDEYVSKLCDKGNINKTELSFSLFKKYSFSMCTRNHIHGTFFKIQ